MDKSFDVFNAFLSSEERGIFDKIFSFEEKRKVVRW